MASHSLVWKRHLFIRKKKKKKTFIVRNRKDVNEYKINPKKGKCKTNMCIYIYFFLQVYEKESVAV